MPQKTKWLGGVFPNLTFESFAISAGYDFTNYGIPISLGAGYIHNKFNYRPIVKTNSDSPDAIDKFDSYDSFDSFSIGAGYEYLLRFNVGVSLKTFNSNLSDLPTEMEGRTASVEGMAFDLGAMVTLPVSDLLWSEAKLVLDKKIFLYPDVECTIGYSITNLGDEIHYYGNPKQSDPLPRTARLGYSLNLALGLSITNKSLKAFDYIFAAEAEDILVNRPFGDAKFEYEGMFGAIAPGKHLIELKGDNAVVVHRGHIFTFFETVTITSGRFNGRGYYNRKTDGLIISTAGTFKLLGLMIENPAIKFILDHISIEYFDTNTFVDSGLDTNFKGIAVYLSGFTF